jgi:hypothetical protein
MFGAPLSARRPDPEGVDVTTNWKRPGLAGVICTTGGFVAGFVVIVHPPSIAAGTEHESCADPPDGSDDATSSMYVSDWPAVIGSLIPCPGVTLKQKSTAAPLSGTAWGLPGALSTNESVALRGPLIVGHIDAGWNATLIEHVPPGGTLVPVQESVLMTKSPAFAPDLLTDVIVSAPAYWPLLLLVTTMGCGVPGSLASWLPKLTPVGTEIEACVADPESATVAGVPPAIFNVAERAPTAVG